MRYSSYSYLGFLHTEMSRFRREDRRVGNAEKCHMQGTSSSGACPVVGTDVTPPTRPWKTARLPSLSNFGDRVP